MPWYKILELIENHVKCTSGAAFGLHQSELCGWHASYHVFGESDTTYIGKDYPDKRVCLELLAKHLLLNYDECKPNLNLDSDGDIVGDFTKVGNILHNKEAIQIMYVYIDEDTIKYLVDSEVFITHYKSLIED